MMTAINMMVPRRVMSIIGIVSNTRFHMSMAWALLDPSITLPVFVRTKVISSPE